MDSTLAARPLSFHPLGKIHAKAVRGPFNTLRWLVAGLTQLVFFGACWLNWESQGSLRQVILLDIAHERLYFFGLVLWPQDALLLALLLILAATGLFLVTALVGRVFCGFACPQTVYTLLFTTLERWSEGDHLARRRLDNGPLTVEKLARKGVKHGLWLLLAGWIGITFVGYFTPIRELLPALVEGHVGPWEGFWIGFYGLFTYVLAGLARESVCQHMCPYSRFQGVMFDPATVSVSYDAVRGEPRGALRAERVGGACVDCGICVQVCPTGIDIRQGLQYQCINCGLCIDACDGVMKRLGQPPKLIRFAPEGLSAPRGWAARPRLAVYVSLIVLSGGLGAWTLAQRSPLLVDVLRDRGALWRETSTGGIENAYTLKVMNRIETAQTYAVAVEGLPGAVVAEGREVTVAAGAIQPLAVTVAVDAAALEGRRGVQPITFRVGSRTGGEAAVLEPSRFVLP